MNKKSVVLSAVCVLGWMSFTLPVLAAAPSALKNNVYTRNEQISALRAVEFGRNELKVLNSQLDRAYGANAVFINMPPSKSGSKSSKLALTRRNGKKLILQLAAYEPLMSLCAVDSGVYYLTGHVANVTAELLVKRGLATRAETQSWVRNGGAMGERQLGAISRLDCVPVRAAFNGSVMKLEDSYILLNAAAEQKPEEKKVCPCS